MADLCARQGSFGTRCDSRSTDEVGGIVRASGSRPACKRRIRAQRARLRRATSGPDSRNLIGHLSPLDPVDDRLEQSLWLRTVPATEMFERFLRSKKIHRRIALQTPHFMSIPPIISQSDLVVTVPHAVGIFVRNVHMDIRIAQPPMRTPKIDLKLHWHRNFQRDAKNKWLRDLVASLFTDESDEWRS
jgi:DNA-binding transcriptional LysR family regulator